MARQVYQFCKVQQKVVPVEEVLEVRESIHIINHEIPPTRNPLNPREIFTDATKLRQRYKEAGVEEIGTAYENGYDPHARATREIEQRNREIFRARFRENYNRGR